MEQPAVAAKPCQMNQAAEVSVMTTATLPHDLQLLKQGAEAKVHTCTFLGRPTIVKERFKKGYRHPALDRSLTAQRTKGEVRCMMRCRAHGILTPAIYHVDLHNSCIFMEHVVDSQTVRDYIRGVQASSSSNPSEGDAPDGLLRLARRIGFVLGAMHQKHIVHGDLTTSNLLLVGDPGAEPLRLCLIDFGLGSLEGTAEDKGVDLYVLERALLSTHPSTERLFDVILESYAAAYGAAGGKKEAAEVMRKLEEVRLRGRKRTMVG